MNDYVAAYHDSVLLIGEVMRKIWGELGDGSDMQAINHSYFRNITFYGKNMDGRKYVCNCCDKYIFAAVWQGCLGALDCNKACQIQKTYFALFNDIFECRNTEKGKPPSHDCRHFTLGIHLSLLRAGSSCAIWPVVLLVEGVCCGWSPASPVQVRVGPTSWTSMGTGMWHSQSFTPPNRKR